MTYLCVIFFAAGLVTTIKIANFAKRKPILWVTVYCFFIFTAENIICARLGIPEIFGTFAGIILTGLALYGVKFTKFPY